MDPVPRAPGPWCRGAAAPPGARGSDAAAPELNPRRPPEACQARGPARRQGSTLAPRAGPSGTPGTSDPKGDLTPAREILAAKIALQANLSCFPRISQNPPDADRRLPGQRQRPPRGDLPLRTTARTPRGTQQRGGGRSAHTAQRLPAVCPARCLSVLRVQPPGSGKRLGSSRAPLAPNALRGGRPPPVQGRLATTPFRLPGPPPAAPTRPRGARPLSPERASGRVPRPPAAWAGPPWAAPGLARLLRPPTSSLAAPTCRCGCSSRPVAPTPAADSVRTFPPS